MNIHAKSSITLSLEDKNQTHRDDLTISKVLHLAWNSKFVWLPIFYRYKFAFIELETTMNTIPKCYKV